MLGRVCLRTTLAVLCLIVPVVASAQTKLLRFPDIYGDRVVFTYGGDLWTAGSGGGTATRLTAHPGLEVFGKFSPDGKWIAFTGQYDGDEQVYVVSSTGGVPKQLTFYPAKGPLTPRWGWDNQVMGWGRDGQSIIFRSQRDSWALPIAKLYKVSVNGGPAEALPMPEAGSGDMSPDSAKMVYSPRSRDFRSEKRYGGGQANTLYIFDLKSYDAKKISDGPRPWRDAMWIGNTIYFNSDRDGHFNIYAYDTGSGKNTAVTTSKQWDVRWPSSDNEGQIVYELNGELQVLDTRSKQSNAISITVPDDGIYKRPRTANVAGFLEDFGLSPKGERALFCARGDIFTVPIEKGPTRNLTHSSGAHDKWPRWSPDGSRIAYISDQTGEEEVWIIAQDGATPAQQLTTGGKAMRYAPEWSPDGKKIAFSDKDGRVYVVTVADKNQVQIADDAYGTVRDYVWSPKGNYLAFSLGNANNFNSINVWSAADNKVTRVTDPNFNSQNPAWDPSGNYLYFLSDHDFAPQVSSIEYNYALNRQTSIYALALRKDVKHPFPPESDEVTVAKDEEPKLKPEGELTSTPATTPAATPTPSGTPSVAPAATTATKPVLKPEIIDFEGIVSRAARVPLPADNYGGLSAKTGHLLYIVGPPFILGRAPERPPSIRIFSAKDRKETMLVEGSGNYAMSDDGSKILVGQAGGFALFDATPQGDKSRKPVSTSGLMADIVPSEEWNQIFNEVWRRYRDWFYVTNMHGFDWEKLREQYRPWLKYVAHRSDLNYVISEMISELTIQHAYIEGGDFQLPARPRSGLPGARFEVDKASGRYRVSKIFGGQNEEELYRSPLTEVGVNIKVGDYILAVNGEDLKGDRDIYQLLRNRPDNPVQLLVNSTPEASGARTVSYRPVADESQLIYGDWIEANRRKVLELSNGRIGYLHVPDMGPAGIREFIKWFYPQLDKEGLIVDVRVNGGGNVSRMIIERLRRKLLGVNYARNSDSGATYPDGVFIGPMATILNENSSSDGDIFPYMFREAGLGPLIGKRSWGGVVGISGQGTLIDGGTVFVPLSALASSKGEWIIEGYGVDPDIEVDNEPREIMQGHDQQLERAVQEVMKKLNTPVKLPPRPAAPVKTPK
ncbi:MAG: S41 family peptidase [Pyrinomonadaceae bacterium]